MFQAKLVRSSGLRRQACGEQFAFKLRPPVLCATLREIRAGLDFHLNFLALRLQKNPCARVVAQSDGFAEYAKCRSPAL
jgi:hypothetical protein